MLKIKLPKNRIEFLAAGAERRIKLGALERGWEFYHRGLVNNMSLVQGHILQADVRGKELFKVSLNLEQFERSECTCSTEGYCRHMAALIFYCYSAHGRPELLLMQLKHAIAAKRKARPGLKSGKTSEQTAAELLPELTPREWSRFFEQRFHGYSLSNQNSVEQFNQAVWEGLGETAADWAPPLKLLYRLHLNLYIMAKMEQFHNDNLSSYISFYIENGCKVVAAACWDILREMIDQQQQFRQASLQYPRHWQETITVLREKLVQHPTGPVQWTDVYRFLWWRVFFATAGNKREAVATEREHLQGLEKQHSIPRVKDNLLLAATLFNILDGDDPKAMKQLTSLHTKQFSDFYILLESLSVDEEWERLITWLRWLLPALAKSKQEEFNTGCSYWVKAVHHQPTDDEWIKVMVSLLPRSYHYYTDYLMQTKRFRQWVDLQLAAGISLVNLYTSELRTVESHNPALLLPLYHQSVERAVAEKNRDSYKLAIGHLKKLQGLYQQLNQESLWSQYIEKLHTKYSRLRAFREELMKGQWVP